jgi:hypothetical protein
MSTLGHQIKMYAYGLLEFGILITIVQYQKGVICTDYRVHSCLHRQESETCILCNAFISLCEKNWFCLVNLFEIILLLTVHTVCEDVHILKDV